MTDPTFLVVRNGIRAEQLRPLVRDNVRVVYWGEALGGARAEHIVVLDNVSTGSSVHAAAMWDWYDSSLLTCLKPGGVVL
jgi:hypothetical protein